MRFSEICTMLSDAGIENPRNEAEILIEELLGEDKVYEEREYNSDTLTNALERRCAGYPLQYIIGKWWFEKTVLKFFPLFL